MNATLALPILIELLVKSAAILLATTFIDRACRRASAAQRHGIWLAAFIALLLLPTTRLMAPRWNLSPVPRQPIVRVHVTGEAADASEAQVVSIPVPEPETPVNKPEVLPHSFDRSTAALRLWLAGSAVLLGWRVLGGTRLHFLGRARVPGDPALHTALRQTAAEAGVSRRIALRISETCRVPLTWGTLRPVLMLPAEAATWPDDRLHATLHHELAHIRRGDHGVRLIADVARAFYWPNPLVWFASRALRNTQEQACDDLVLGAGASPTGYATLLCEVARRFSAPSGAVAMAQPSTLETRVRAIVDTTRNRRPAGLGLATISALAVALALLLCAAAQLRAGEQASEAAAATVDAAPPVPGAAAEATTESPDPKSPKEKTPQIVIEAKFIEVAADVDAKAFRAALQIPEGPAPDVAAKFEKLLFGDGKLLFGDPPAVPPKPQPDQVQLIGVLMDPAIQAASKALTTMKGVKILATPHVVIASGRRANIEVGGRLTYATAWEKGAARGTWKPTILESRLLGVTLDVEPVAGPDGATLDLQIAPHVVELLGFIDPETGKPVISGSGALTDEGSRRQPVFAASRVITTSVSVFDGQTIILELAPAEPVKPFEKKVSKKRTLVFITGKRVWPNGEKASPVAPSPAAPETPQVEIAAQFYLLTPNLTSHAELLSSFGVEPRSGEKFPGVTAILTDASFQIVSKRFQMKKDFDLLSAPRVTTKSGQRAVIEIIRERRYATEWAKSTKPGAWKPTAFETRNVGVTLESEPKIQDDGTIAIDLTPQLVDFLGFKNLETGKPTPKGTDDSAPEGPRLKAYFSGLKLNSHVVMKSGETVMLEPLEQQDDVGPFAGRVRKAKPVVFVTVRRVNPAGIPVPSDK